MAIAIVSALWAPGDIDAAANSAPALGQLPPPGLYPRLVVPSEYPAYEHRGFKVPTWQTFRDRPQMVGGRYNRFAEEIPEELLTEAPDDATIQHRPWLVGRVFRPNIGILYTQEPEFSASLRHMREVGMYLFNVGGYGPGSPLKGGFGQCQVTEAQNKALTEILGDQFLGFDLGEQDGRYHNGFEDLQLPSPRDREGQHRVFREWCDRAIGDQGGRLTLLSTLWGWHYPSQDGAMALLGAECHNKFGVTNPQVQYAFLRGAGKQYGLLWYGDVSIFSTFGVTYWKLDSSGDLVAHPGGGSANLMRRLFLTEWLWNSCILGFEGSTTASKKATKRTRLSPIGQVQADTERLLQRGFSTGVMQTPVAIVQDYFSGWMPPRTNTAQFRAFNSLPYAPGDYLTDNLLSLLFPGYENCGWFMDERGALTPTPYGDIADCLLSDAPAEVLAHYNLVLCSGLQHDLPGVRDRLDAFLASGGVALITGDDASRLWPEYCRASTFPVPAGQEIKWASGATDKEKEAFELHEANLPAQARVLATCAGRPAVASIAQRGGGNLLVVFAATGMNRNALKVKPGGHPMWGGENTSLERPFRLLAHAARAYKAALSAQQLFSAGEGLTVTTCRRADGSFVVGVSNPGLASRPFTINSHIGPLKEVKEVDLGTPIHQMPGYWPHQWSRYFPKPTEHRDDLGEFPGESDPSDQNHIRGGDMRFFEVALSRCDARTRPDLKLAAWPKDRLLRVPDLVTLRERLLAWPRFAYCFDGVAIEAQALLDTDPQWLRDNAAWFQRHGLRILVLARGQGTQGTSALAAIVQRLSLLGTGRELLVDEISDDLRHTAEQAGVILRTPSQTRLLQAGTIPGRGGNAIEILEGDWRSWDGLCRDVRAAWLGAAPGRVVGPGESRAIGPLGPIGPIQEPQGRARLIALHGIGDLPQAIAQRPGLREKFGGLMLDSAWLAGRSREALEKDRAWLAANKLKVAVDFTRSINRFPDLTFSSGVPHRYAASERTFDDVLEKTQLLGAKDVVIVSHCAAETGDDWGNQRKGIERFLAKAESLGLATHWRTSSRRPPRDLAKYASLVAELQRQFPNLRVAASVADEPNPERLARAWSGCAKPSLWLLAAPNRAGGRAGQQFLPLATLPQNQVSQILAASQGATQVFDADYLTWDEVLRDAGLAGRGNGRATSLNGLR